MLELTMAQKNELTPLVREKGLSGRPWTDTEIQQLAEDYFINGLYFREGDLKGKPNCLAIGLRNGNIELKGSSYKVKTREGKVSYFSKNLTSEKMFFLLDDEGFWNGQTYKEVFNAK